jgi:pimeloyl-ACP methyl ester carboxylesterase
MPHVQANGLDIAYRVDGAGPPLVLLHGASSSGEADFATQLPVLAGAFRCHVPDARGHGGTRWDAAGGFRYEWLVDDLLAFVDELGLATFHLLGFSMGGATALGFAARFPERLRTLVLVGITPEREPRASVARRLFDPDRIERHDPAWAAELNARHDPVQGPGAWQRLLPALARDVAAQDLLTPGELARIDCPVLVAVGDRDPFVPVDQAWRLKRQLHDARLFVAPDCGHEVLLRRPALSIEALAGFYRATEAVATRRAAPPAGAVPLLRAAARSAVPYTSARGEAAGPLEPDTTWLKEAAR